MRSIVPVFLGAVLAVVPVQAQNAPPAAPAQLAFDVASVKENKEQVSRGGGMQLMPGGGIRAVHMQARSLITIAYSLKTFQLAGEPTWTSETFYDVNARPAGTATREQNFNMLQALLADRFKLAVHRERRPMNGFGVVQLKKGALGPNLRPSTIDCVNTPTSSPRCRQGGITDASIQMNGTSISWFAEILTNHVGAPLSDDTELSGTFDLELRWSNDLAPAGDLPSIFTALQDQLGLKLERRRVTTEVLVVDHIERPSPD